jgi:hypothetical protein
LNIVVRGFSLVPGMIFPRLEVLLALDGIETQDYTGSEVLRVRFVLRCPTELSALQTLFQAHGIGGKQCGSVISF